MSKTFETENGRKDSFFEAWNNELIDRADRPDAKALEEIFEGLVTVSDLSRNRFGLRLDDGRKIDHVSLSPEVGRQVYRDDQIYVVLGRKKDKWWILDVISIGSFLGEGKSGFHLTLNPLLVLSNTSSREDAH